MSNIWQNPYVSVPFFCLLSGILDEFLLRRYPFISLVCVTLCLIVLPFALIITQTPFTFGVLKAITVIVPVIAILLFRLANLHNRESKNKITGEDNKCTCDGDCSDKCSCMTKLYKLLLKPNVIFGYNIFIFLFLVINIIEAIIYEILFGESHNNIEYNWSKYMNGVTGIILVITIPLPFKNTGNYYFDNNKYCDYILDFVSAEYNINNKFIIYMIWCTLYTSWDGEFVSRFLGYTVFFGQISHLFVPLIISYLYKDKNIIHTCGIYLQSRSHNLLVFLIIIIPLRQRILKTDDSQFKLISDGIVLMVWSFVNLIIGMVYLIWYYWTHFINSNHVNKTKNSKTNENQIAMTISESINTSDNPQL